jgi:hypothetical protein
MKRQIRHVCRRATGAGVLATALATAWPITMCSLHAQVKAGFEYRVLATNKTSTMEKELNEGAEAGFRLRSVMGGDTATGGSEVVVIMVKADEAKGHYGYKLLATSKTSTMEKELQEAADAGFEYVDQTIFKSAFGGQEVVCILERGGDPPARKPTYKLLATTKTSTLQKELLDAGAAGYQVMGMTVAKTALAGKEIVAILRRPGDQ